MKDRVVTDEAPILKALHQLFIRHRDVYFVNGCKKFYCGHFERNRIRCEHIDEVLESLGEYIETSYHDFSVYWWKTYLFHGIIVDHKLEIK